MPWVIPLAAVAGSAIAGSQASSANRAAAQQAEQSALQNYLNIHVPDPAQQQIILQRYQKTGQIDPQMQQAIAQQQTQLKGMQIDPTSRSAEVQALQQMQNISQNGGMDAQAKQQEQQALNSSNANEAGQRGAIMQNFAARGVGGSGAQLAAELQAQQGDANQAAQLGLNSAASGEQRALQAMTASSQMGSQLNNQDYGQAAKAAEAQDAINRFNTQNQQSVMDANTRATNTAQAQNTNNAQNLANSNVDLTNKEETANQGLVQQNFTNQMQKAVGQANAANGVATQYNKGADAASAQWGGIGSAIAQGAGAYGQYANKKGTNPSSAADLAAAKQSGADEQEFQDNSSN